MPEKTRPCPQCGGTMSFRLGEYQCGSCSYSESGAAPPEERRGSQPPPSQWESRVSRGTRATPQGSSPGALGGARPAPPASLWSAPDAQESQAESSPGLTSWELGYRDLHEGSPKRRGGTVGKRKSSCAGVISVVLLPLLLIAGLLLAHLR